MRFAKTSFAFLVLLLASFLSPVAWGNTSTYYAKLTATAAPTGSGTVYVSTSNSDSGGAYAASSSATGSKTVQGSSAEVTLYAFAKANDGYRFLGWNSSSTSTDDLKTANPLTVSLTATGTSQENPKPSETSYAHFQKITATSITLNVGDSVRFYYKDLSGKNLNTPTTGNSVTVKANAQSAAYVEITATKAGSSTVTIKAGSGNTLSDYDVIDVTVTDELRLFELGKDESVTLDCPCTEVSQGGSTWTKNTSQYYNVNQSGNAGGGSVTVTATSVGGNDSTASGDVKVSNVTGNGNALSGAEYTFKFFTTKPWPVEFCQGDKVQIWYNNEAEKDWFLLINGQRFNANALGYGTQMHVTLTAQNPTERCYIVGTADTVGEDGAEPDLVVISDGENYYSYRMSVSPERVVSPGDRVTMVCSTVAKNPWDSAVVKNAKEDYTPYVRVENDGGGAASHSTTATITGLALADETYVEVRDDLHTEGEVNAQGAVYTLKTRVYGPPMIQVHLSPTAYVNASLSALTPAAETTYAIRERILQPGEAAQATSTDRSGAGYHTYSADAISAEFLEGGDAGPSFAVRFEAAAGSFFGQYRAFEIVDTLRDEVVAIFLVNVTYNFTMDQGQKAASVFDYAVTSPWVSVSDHPEVATITPVYSKQFGVYSAECVAKGMGDFVAQSTNATTAAAYWGIAASVRGVQQLNLDLNVGQDPTNVTIALDGEYVANDWALGAVSAPTVTAALAPAADGHSAELTVTPLQKGTAMFTVTSKYLVVNVSVYVGESTVEKYRVPGVRQVVYGETTDLGADASASQWQASVEDATYVSLVKTSGNAGELIQFKGENVGTTRILVESASMVYIYTVEVLPATADRPQIVVGVRDAVTNAITFVDRKDWGKLSAYSDDPLAAKVSLDKTNGKFIVTGALDGETVVHITDGNTVWNVPVLVHERDIYKTIRLSKGQNSASTYSYTFDTVLGINNLDPDLVTVTRNGNTVTITPIAIGIAQVDVECFVDNLGESSRLHYTVDIEELPSKQDVWQPKKTDSYSDGYLAYRGATSAYEVDGELVLVFSNANEIGQIDIPEGCIAYMDILSVGGGGGGGSVAAFGKGGGGGGAGGFVYQENKRYSTGTLGIVVGKGGQGSSTVVAQNEPGQSGGESIVSNAFGHVFVSAAGGGGGAAPATALNTGLNGGSGGGGAYADRKPGIGGQGVSGQGAGGAQPNELNCGGGGGGAGGNGGADQSRGAGKTNTITGEEVGYAVGGRGGRADSDATALAGQGPGFGGDGGNGGPGGDGADGVVVVRVLDLIKNILVPIPTTNDMVTARFEWANNATNVAFSYEGKTFRSPSDAHPYAWDDALERVKGTTSVYCYEGEDLDEEGNPIKEGVGYYSFTLSLKKGFAWDDGTEFGSTEVQRYQWVVTEDFSNTDARMDVRKEVEWETSTTAVVRVTAETSPEMSGGGTPNVLFLGTLCDGHGMKKAVVSESLKTILSVANVEYDLMGVNSSGGYSQHFTGSFKQGEQSKVDAAINGFREEHAYHYALKQFYGVLYNQLLNPATKKNYDYIVFEFDGSRIADGYSKSDYEAAVAAELVKYYESGSVVWIVDNCYSKLSEPWNNGEDSEGPLYEYWRPNTYYNNGNDRNMALANFVGLVGMFDPVNYQSATTATSLANLVTGGRPFVSRTQSRTTYYASPTRYANQATYDKVASVTDLLASVIKVKPFNLDYTDKIVSPANGLTITGVTVQGCTNAVDGKVSSNATDWFDIIDWDAETGRTQFHEDAKSRGIPGASMSVDLQDNLVLATVSNIEIQVWLRFNTHVLDDGTFCSDETAEYNQQTDKYEKDPNDGPVYVSMVDDNGMNIGVDGEAETDIPLRFTRYTVKGHVVNGQIFVGGRYLTQDNFKEGNDVPVLYRGLGGYKLSSVTVDANVVYPTHGAVDEDIIGRYVIQGIDAPHDVWVTYERFYGTEESHPVTTNYDGEAHVFPVELFDWDPAYATEVRYSLDPNASKDDYMTAEEFCEFYTTNKTVDITAPGTYTINYCVFAYQPGYGEDLTKPGWVWVETGVTGSDTVTITRPQLVVTPEYVYLPYNTLPFPDNVTYTVTGFVDGEDISVIDTTGWSVSSSYEVNDPVGQYETFMVGVSTGEIVGNYEIVCRPGLLDVVQKSIIIGGVQQSNFLDPEDPLVDTGVDRVEKPYDGIDTNLTVTVNQQKDEVYKIRYWATTGDDPTRPDEDAAWLDEMPKFNHAGTNKVWYSVAEWDPVAQTTTTNLFPVLNYQYVIITPQELTLRSASAEKRYDGTPLTADGVEVIGGRVIEGDVLDCTVTGAQTELGTGANTFEHALRREGSGEDATSDYTVTKVEGTLTVTPGVIWINDTEYKPEEEPRDYGDTGVEDVEKPYDGIGTNIVVMVTRPAEGAVVTFATSKNAEVWSDDLCFTNAGS